MIVLTKKDFFTTVTFVTDCYFRFCRYIVLIYMYAYSLVTKNRWLCWCYCRFCCRCCCVVVVVVFVVVAFLVTIWLQW